MPERSFRVRHYECDAYGHLNNTAYLHYLEEVEVDTGTAAGRRPCHIDIRYVTPASFGDTVTVTAADGPDGARHYTFLVAAARIAQATAQWAEPGASGTDTVPPPPPPPDEVFRRARRIDWQDVDASATTGPGALAAIAEDCGLALCDAYGWPLDRCTAEGFAMVVRRHEIASRGLVRMGDELEIATWASDVGRASAIRHYVMSSGGEVVARHVGIQSKDVYTRSLDEAARAPAA